jgi:hypothetical protein
MDMTALSWLVGSVIMTEEIDKEPPELCQFDTLVNIR